MSKHLEAVEDRTPESIAVIVADDGSVKAAHAAGFSALCVSDIAAADAEDLVSKLARADATVIRIPAEEKKGEGKKHPAWNLARVLRDSGTPAQGRYCQDAPNLAKWIENGGVDKAKQVLDQAAGRAISRTTCKSVGGYVAVGYDGDRSVI